MPGDTDKLLKQVSDQIELRTKFSDAVNKEIQAYRQMICTQQLLEAYGNELIKIQTEIGQQKNAGGLAALGKRAKDLEETIKAAQVQLKTEENEYQRAVRDTGGKGGRFSPTLADKARELEIGDELNLARIQAMHDQSAYAMSTQESRVDALFPSPTHDKENQALCDAIVAQLKNDFLNVQAANLQKMLDQKQVQQVAAPSPAVAAAAGAVPLPNIAKAPPVPVVAVPLAAAQAPHLKLKLIPASPVVTGAAKVPAAAPAAAPSAFFNTVNTAFQSFLTDPTVPTRNQKYKTAATNGTLPTPNPKSTGQPDNSVEISFLDDVDAKKFMIELARTQAFTVERDVSGVSQIVYESKDNYLWDIDTGNKNTLYRADPSRSGQFITVTGDSYMKKGPSAADAAAAPQGPVAAPPPPAPAKAGPLPVQKKAAAPSPQAPLGAVPSSEGADAGAVPMPIDQEEAILAEIKEAVKQKLSAYQGQIIVFMVGKYVLKTDPPPKFEFDGESYKDKKDLLLLRENHEKELVNDAVKKGIALDKINQVRANVCLDVSSTNQVGLNPTERNAIQDLCGSEVCPQLCDQIEVVLRTAVLNIKQRYLPTPQDQPQPVAQPQASSGKRPAPVAVKKLGSPEVQLPTHNTFGRPAVQPLPTASTMASTGGPGATQVPPSVRVRKSASKQPSLSEVEVGLLKRLEDAYRAQIQSLQSFKSAYALAGRKTEYLATELDFQTYERMVANIEGQLPGAHKRIAEKKADILDQAIKEEVGDSKQTVLLSILRQMRRDLDTQAAPQQPGGVRDPSAGGAAALQHPGGDVHQASTAGQGAAQVPLNVGGVHKPASKPPAARRQPDSPPAPLSPLHSSINDEDSPVRGAKASPLAGKETGPGLIERGLNWFRPNKSPPATAAQQAPAPVVWRAQAATASAGAPERTQDAKGKLLAEIRTAYIDQLKDYRDLLVHREISKSAGPQSSPKDKSTEKSLEIKHEVSQEKFDSLVAKAVNLDIEAIKMDVLREHGTFVLTEVEEQDRVKNDRKSVEINRFLREKFQELCEGDNTQKASATSGTGSDSPSLRFQTASLNSSQGSTAPTAEFKKRAQTVHSPAAAAFPPLTAADHPEADKPQSKDGAQPLKPGNN